MDRNQGPGLVRHGVRMSLSARRAWIEIPHVAYAGNTLLAVALRKESVDRNIPSGISLHFLSSRSPQGERG